VRTALASLAIVRIVLAGLVVLTVAGCGSPEKDARFPARPEGCDVQVFPEAPTMPTDNIGPVGATCGQDISNDDCLRTLKDQACKLGGDVVWGVADVPSQSQGKKKLAGRAAHTKTGK
jgi:hypothetical protein